MIITIDKKTHFYLAFYTLCIFSSYAYADEIQQDIRVTSGLEYDSNPLMAENSPNDVLIAKILPNYKYRHATYQDEQYLNIGLIVHRTTDESVSVNRQDPTIDFGISHNFERGQLGFGIGADRRATRSTELDSSGLLVGNASRISKHASVNGLVELSPLTQLTLNISYYDYSYSGNIALNDYRLAAMTTGLNHLVSEYISTYTNLTINKQYLSFGNNKLINPIIGVKFLASDMLTLDGAIGLNKTSGNNENTGLYYKITSDYTIDKDQLSLSASRSVFASGLNALIESNKYNLDWKHFIRDGLDVKASVARYENKSVNSFNTTLYTITIEKELTKEWLVSTHLTRRESSNNAYEASADVLGLTFTYALSNF